MKFKYLLLFFFVYSCTATTKFENRVPYNSKGFAYIYNDRDVKDKIIKGKLDNKQLQVSHNQLRNNTLIKVSNPKTNDSLTIRNNNSLIYPDFYKILITKEVAKKLNIDERIPLVEILEIKKNKSFVAKKAKIHNEEKQISSNAPVTSVKISNISKNKNKIKKNEHENFNILIASFYSNETANFLKKRIIKELPSYDIKKLKILKKNNKEIQLISGPYNTINLMKNDYILLKRFGFEELDFFTND